MQHIGLYLVCTDQNIPQFAGPSSSPTCLVDIAPPQPNHSDNSYLIA